MKLFSNLMIAAISGILTGASLLFLAIVAATGFAYLTSSSIYLPGIIQAWFTTENDMPALNFNPNFTGMLGWIGVVAVMFCLTAWRRTRETQANTTHAND